MSTIVHAYHNDRNFQILFRNYLDLFESTVKSQAVHRSTELRYVSLLSGGFTTMAVINPPEKKLAKPTSVQWLSDFDLGHFKRFITELL